MTTGVEKGERNYAQPRCSAHSTTTAGTNASPSRSATSSRTALAKPISCTSPCVRWRSTGQAKRQGLAGMPQSAASTPTFVSTHSRHVFGASRTSTAGERSRAASSHKRLKRKSSEPDLENDLSTSDDGVGDVAGCSEGGECAGSGEGGDLADASGSEVVSSAGEGGSVICEAR